MQKSFRFILTVLFLGSYLLSACTGAVPQSDDVNTGSGVNSNEAVVDNVNNTNANDSGSNTDGANDNMNSNVNANGNGNENNNANSIDDVDDNLELHGVIDVIADGMITIDGVPYNLADFTEFKDVIAVGDQVKIHFIINADGTFTINEIELLLGSNDNFNGNVNFNGNSNDDDHGNSNSSSNSNSNSDDDDHGNSNSNSNSNSNGNSNDND